MPVRMIAEVLPIKVPLQVATTRESSRALLHRKLLVAQTEDQLY